MKIPEHKNFFAVNGRSANTLSELKGLVSELSEHDFNHHVTPDRNDFANWVRDILHEDHLAERLRKVSSKSEMIELITDSLVKEKEVEIQKSDEFKRFIAKEFIYGMFFGIILGMILSKLL